MAKDKKKKDKSHPPTNDRKPKDEKKGNSQTEVKEPPKEEKQRKKIGEEPASSDKDKTDWVKPVKEEIPASDQDKTDWVKPVKEEIPASDQDKTDQVKPVKEEIPASDQDKTDWVKPVKEEIPASDQDKTDQVKPVKEEIPASDQDKTDQVKPVKEEIPASDQDKTDQVKPAKEEIPASDQDKTDSEKSQEEESPSLSMGSIGIILVIFILSAILFLNYFGRKDKDQVKETVQQQVQENIKLTISPTEVTRSQHEENQVKALDTVKQAKGKETGLTVENRLESYKNSKTDQGIKITGGTWKVDITPRKDEEGRFYDVSYEWKENEKPVTFVWQADIKKGEVLSLNESSKALDQLDKEIMAKIDRDHPVSSPTGDIIDNVDIPSPSPLATPAESPTEIVLSPMASETPGVSTPPQSPAPPQTLTPAPEKSDKTETIAPPIPLTPNVEDLFTLEGIMGDTAIIKYKDRSYMKRAGEEVTEQWVLAYLGTREVTLRKGDKTKKLTLRETGTKVAVSPSPKTTPAPSTTKTPAPSTKAPADFQSVFFEESKSSLKLSGSLGDSAILQFKDKTYNIRRGDQTADGWEVISIGTNDVTLRKEGKTAKLTLQSTVPTVPPASSKTATPSATAPPSKTTTAPGSLPGFEDAEFELQFTGMMGDTALINYKNTTFSLKRGDQFPDGWTITSMDSRTITLRKGNETRQMELQMAPPPKKTP